MVRLNIPHFSRPMTAFAEGRDIAKHFGCKFFETSAKIRHNVDEAFSNLVREIRKYNKVCLRCSLKLFRVLTNYLGVPKWSIDY